MWGAAVPSGIVEWQLGPESQRLHWGHRVTQELMAWLSPWVEVRCACVDQGRQRAEVGATVHPPTYTAPGWAEMGRDGLCP